VIARASPAESADVRSLGPAGCLIAALASVSAGCASRHFVPPVSAPAPFPEGAAAWDEATRVCRETSTLAGELRVSGRIGGQRVPTIVIGAAVEGAGNIALDARYAGASVFVLRGTHDHATLVLTERREIVTGRAEEILDALVGVPLGPARLLAILTGCVTSRREVTRSERVEAFARVGTDDATVYLTRTENHWRVRAGAFEGFVVDYRAFGADLPRRLAVRSVAGRAPAVDLAIELAAYETTPRDPVVFRPVVPEGAAIISLDQLRDAGPLGRR
jgi:hypothetical protein